MNQRIIPWGTVLAGAVALGTAVLIGLTEIAGVSVPFRSAGPGAVIVVGVRSQPAAQRTQGPG